MTALAEKQSMDIQLNEGQTQEESIVAQFFQQTKSNETNCPLKSLLFSPEETAMKQEKYIYHTGKNQMSLSISITTFQEKSQEIYNKVCVIHDQSLYEELETSRMEAQYQKSLFAMVNHELRNPLQGILGIFEIILMGVDMASIKDQCRIGISTGNLMLVLVNDILDISQLETCNFKLAEQVFSVSEAITNCIEIMKYRYQQKGIDLRWKVKGEISIKNDKNRYQQIVINLLSNALKFTSTGYVKVTSWYNESAQQLFTKIKDTGEGIKEEEQGKMFTMYCKLQKQQSANPTGVGLGLSICKKLCEAMDGSISFKSVYNKGTTFTFYIKNFQIPVLAEYPSECNFEGAYEEEKISPFPESFINLEPKKRVLVVDDEMVCGHIIASYCKSLNVNVEIVIIFAML